MKLIYDESNKLHAKSFLMTLKIFNMILRENFPITYSRTDQEQRLDIIFDFLSLQSENTSIHREILKRNTLVHAQNRWPKLKSEDFLVVVNLFLLLYLANVATYDSEVMDDITSEITSYMTILAVLDALGSSMSDIITVGFGPNYDREDMEMKLLNYEKVMQNVVH